MPAAERVALYRSRPVLFVTTRILVRRRENPMRPSSACTCVRHSGATVQLWGLHSVSHAQQELVGWAVMHVGRHKHTERHRDSSAIDKALLAPQVVDLLSGRLGAADVAGLVVLNAHRRVAGLAGGSKRVAGIAGMDRAGPCS